MVTARYIASRVLDVDPEMKSEEHQLLKKNLDIILEGRPNWSRIS
jgi:hypothetical protein